MESGKKVLITKPKNIEDKITKPKMKSQKNVGIELLRIVLMLMVLMLHYCGKGGFLSGGVLTNTVTEIAWLIRAFSMVAVNCFVLITGYFSIKSVCNYKKVFKIWREVIFYCISIFLIFKIFTNTNISIKQSLIYFFPIMLKTYWFISCYVVLYLFAPYLNACLNNIDKQAFKRLIIILLFINCASSILTGINMTSIDATKGYGILWFVTLYCIAAYIRLYGREQYSTASCFIKYVIISLIIYCSRLVLWKVAGICNLENKINYDVFYYYNSITIAFSSIYLFLFFKNLNIKHCKNIILKIAPLTLAVYIIHEAPLIRNILYKNILHTDLIDSVTKFIWALPVSCCCIFIICCAIEFLRTKIFKLCGYLNNKMILKIK